MPQRKEIDLSKRCVSDLVSPELQVGASAKTNRSHLFICGLVLCLHFPHFCPFVFSADRRSLLQVCGHTVSGRRHHAAERRSRSGLCQEVRLRRQVGVIYLINHRPNASSPHILNGFWFPDSLFNVFCRFLVHRYSVLQQHVEDNAADGIDEPLDTNHAPNGKIEFHDDSDEVCRKKLFLLNIT